MLQSASRENRVTVLTASSGFVDFTLNLIISMRRVKVENFVIIAEDLACYQRLNGEFPGHVALSVSPESAQANTSGGQEPGRKSGFTYGTKNYNELVGQRPRYLLQVLKHGYDVLYADTDAVWLEDPYKYFEPDFDLQIASDKNGRSLMH